MDGKKHSSAIELIDRVKPDIPYEEGDPCPVEMIERFINDQPITKRERHFIAGQYLAMFPAMMRLKPEQTELITKLLYHVADADDRN